MPPVEAPIHPARQPTEQVAWVKADLHLHTDEDPFDEIDYTARQLLDLASTQGFRVLAVTLHDKVFDDPGVFARAAEMGILLIRAAEMRIDGADVVLLNISPEEAAGLRDFDDLRRLRQWRGNSLLTFAPHPFYRLGGSIGARLKDHLDCFDAIEYCHFHIPLLNPNASAVRLAAAHNIPLLATSDAHQRRFFGQNYSWLGLEGGAELTIDNVFASIRARRIRRVSPTGGMARFIGLLFFIFCVHPILMRLPGAKRMEARKRLGAARGGPGEKGRRAAST